MAVPYLGEIYALVSAFFYSFSSVAISKNAEGGGTDNGAYLSVLLTAVMSGGLWVFLGANLPPMSTELLSGVLWFVLAGVLAIVFGRIVMFRAVELLGAVEVGILRRLIPVFAALLAVTFLSETITLSISVGFGLVFAGVAIVIVASGGMQALPLSKGRRARSRLASDLRLGRLLGILSSASYGGAYVSRKVALQGLSDPLMGTFIGALTGLFSGGLFALVSPRGRGDFIALFRRPTRWQFIAAASVSTGQIVQFFALSHTTVTAVAIIGSAEMFISAWLSMLVLKTERKPGFGFAVASLLALSGTIVVALD